MYVKDWSYVAIIFLLPFVQLCLLSFYASFGISLRCFCFIIVVSDENPTAQSVILSAMQEWEQSSCLKFVRRTTERNYIEFFKGGG